MDATTLRDILELDRMTVRELREEYCQVFGEEARSSHKEFLRKRIAWRLQALAEGDLSERARRRAEELANDADLRLQAPRVLGPGEIDVKRSSVSRIHREPNNRLPMPGTLLVREYQGKDIVVKVADEGFEYEGTRYRSLSAIARKVTGTKWNGYLFFGLTGKQKGKLDD